MLPAPAVHSDFQTPPSRRVDDVDYRRGVAPPPVADHPDDWMAAARHA